MLNLSLLQVIGICYLVVGVGLLINTKYYKKMLQDFSESRAVMFLSGFLSLVAGYFIIANYNVWVLDWSVIITIVGWGALIKGIILLILPKVMVKISRYFTHHNGWLVFEGIIATILGTLITYVSFFM